MRNSNISTIIKDIAFELYKGKPVKPNEIRDLILKRKINVGTTCRFKILDMVTDEMKSWNK
jgi:hypothetical protein